MKSYQQNFDESDTSETPIIPLPPSKGDGLRKMIGHGI